MLAPPGTQVNRRWHHLDRMGNLDCVTYEDNGDVVAATAYAYDAWGLPRSNVGNWGDDSAYSQDTFVWPDDSTDRGFTNHEMLETIGLIHMNARLYDPVIGQFISPDSVTPAPMSAQNISRYAYVYNNPFRYIDPSGHSSVSADYSGQRSSEVVLLITPDGEVKVWRGKEDLEKLSGETVAELKSFDWDKLVGDILGSTSGLAAESQSAGNAQASAPSGIDLGASAQATTEDEAKQNAPQQTEAAKKAHPTAQGGDWKEKVDEFEKVISRVSDSLDDLIPQPDRNPMINLAGMRQKDDLRNLGFVSAQVVIPATGLAGPKLAAERNGPAAGSGLSDHRPGRARRFRRRYG